MVLLNPVSRSVAALLVDLKNTKQITEFPPNVTIYPGVQTKDILDIINKVAKAQKENEKDRVINLLNDIDTNLAKKYGDLNGIKSTRVISTEVSASNQKINDNQKNTQKKRELINKGYKLKLEQNEKEIKNLKEKNQKLEKEKNANEEIRKILEDNIESISKKYVEQKKPLKQFEETKRKLVKSQDKLKENNKKLTESQKKLEKVKEENISLVLFKNQLEEKNKELIERDEKRNIELREELKKNKALTKKAEELEECEKKFSLLKEKYEKTIPLSRENLSLKNKYEKMKILNKVLKMELDVDENPNKQKNPEEFNNLHRQIKINNEILRQKKMKKK